MQLLVIILLVEHPCLSLQSLRQQYWDVSPALIYTQIRIKV